MYIQLANDPADGEGNNFASIGDSDVDSISDRDASRTKRRRLDHPDPDPDPDDTTINEPGNDRDATSDIQSNAVSTAIEGDQKTKEQRMITALTKKIQKALNVKFSPKKKRDTKIGSPLQMQLGCTDVVVSDSNVLGQLRTQTSSTDILSSDFNVRFENGEFPIQDRSLCLEGLLWKLSSRLVQGAHEMAWKYRFIAACLRTIRNDVSTNCDDFGVSTFTLHRLTTAAGIINSIVNGLWKAWGP